MASSGLPTRLIFIHKAAVADHVGGQDWGKSALDVLGHGRAPFGICPKKEHDWRRLGVYDISRETACGYNRTSESSAATSALPPTADMVRLVDEHLLVARLGHRGCFRRSFLGC